MGWDVDKRTVALRSVSARQPASAWQPASAGKPTPTGPSVSPEARTALQEAMARYEPGGGYGAGVESGIARGRTQAISSGMQNLVSSGLAGTTIAGGLGKKYEEEVAMPARAQVEEGRATAMSSLQVMLAQMEQGGHQANLGRQFTASESALGRQFQGSQSALNREFQGSESALSRYTPATPYRPQLPHLSQPTRQQQQPAIGSVTRQATGSRQPMSFAQPTTHAGPRTPGSYVGSINGQRWIYNEQGIPTREQ
ncbi:hypothetical protein LCGC14_2025450 [marine sediment metagenome]|uniref:Uncharacterized protein n=1 Tax=marine sediment metagenome TaxID=412755 RepID=A0A0F9HTB7_9ZZZZ